MTRISIWSLKPAEATRSRARAAWFSESVIPTTRTP
jgi:hypothetical protein